MATDEWERERCVVLGRDIGLRSGWDGTGDLAEVLFMDFSPADNLRHVLSDASTLKCDFAAGEFIGYDEDGDVTFRADMIATIFDMPRHGRLSLDSMGRPNAIEGVNVDTRTPMQRIAAEETEWPLITGADVRKAHDFDFSKLPRPVDGKMPLVHDEVDLTRDPLIDALEGAGFKIAFVLEPDAPQHEIDAAMKIVRGEHKPDAWEQAKAAANGTPWPVGWAKTVPSADELRKAGIEDADIPAVQAIERKRMGGDDG